MHDYGMTVVHDSQLAGYRDKYPPPVGRAPTRTEALHVYRPCMYMIQIRTRVFNNIVSAIDPLLTKPVLTVMYKSTKTMQRHSQKYGANTLKFRVAKKIRAAKIKD